MNNSNFTHVTLAVVLTIIVLGGGVFYLKNQTSLLTVIVTNESVQVRRATGAGALVGFLTRANIDNSPTGTGSVSNNPAWFASVTSGTTHTAKVTFVSGYTVTAGYCTWWIDASDCTVKSFASVTCTATECPKTFSVASDYTAKVEFRYTSSVATGTIQGITAISGVGPGAGTTVAISGIGSRITASPNYNYSFINLTSGSKTVSVITPTGYTNPQYNYCTNAVGSCHTTAGAHTEGFGSTVTVNVPSGGYVDLWWIFTPATYGAIQGLVQSQGTSAGIGTTLTIVSSNAQKTTGLPYYDYYFTNVVSGSQTVRVTLPPGYSGALYNICFNSTACHLITPWISGTSATVTVPSGGYVDIRWLLTPATTAPPPLLPPTTLVGGWAFCANENQFCSFSGTKEVRYGANGVFNYAPPNTQGTAAFTGGVGCNNSVFGDALPGTAKQCQYRIGKFQLSSRVVVVLNYNNLADVRSTPEGTLLGNRGTGSRGTVVGGPTLLNGTTWLNINFDSGIDGWVRSQYLYYIDQTQLNAGIAVSHSGVPPVKGDVDDGGGDHAFTEPREDMTIIDGILALRCSEGLSPCVPGSVDQNKYYAADVDCSGSVTGDDGINILRFAARFSVATSIHACMATSQREVAGGYFSRDDIGSCSAPNPLTNACSCPAGYHEANFASIRGTDNAFLLPSEVSSESTKDKVLNTAKSVMNLPCTPIACPIPGPKEAAVFLFDKIVQITGLPFPSGDAILFTVPGINVPISYATVVYQLIVLVVEQILSLLSGPYTPGSPGFQHMCVKDQYSSGYGYQGGYSSTKLNSGGNQVNELTTQGYSCPSGTVRDKVARGLRTEIDAQVVDNNFEYVWACRNPNAPLTGVNRSAYGGMYQTNLAGQCISGNVIGGNATTSEAWTWGPNGITFQYRSLLDSPSGDIRTIIKYPCSCRQGYVPIPIASLSDWDQNPTIQWLCTLPLVADVKTPVAMSDKGLIRIRIIDSNSAGVTTAVAVQSAFYQSIQETSSANDYSVAWAGLPTPYGGSGYNYAAAIYKVLVGMPLGYNKASMAVCINDSVTCPNSNTPFKTMSIVSGSTIDPTGRGLKEAVLVIDKNNFPSELRAGAYDDVYIVLAP